MGKIMLIGIEITDATEYVRATIEESDA